MSVLEYILGALLILCSLAVILLVLFQEPKGRGLSGAIGGDMGGVAAGRGRSTDAVMAKYTRILGLAFFVLILAVGAVSLFK